MQTSNKILVKNLPPAYDEQHLQMFFEYEKGRIGQPVKTLTLNRRNNSAIIEFESSRAVDVVLSKRPITIMDKTLEIDVLAAYLEDGEKLGSVNVNGIPESFGTELMRLNLEDQKGVFKPSLCIGDKVRVVTMPTGSQVNQINKFSMIMCGIQKGTEGIVSSIEAGNALVTFPSGYRHVFSLSDIELVL